MWTKKFWKDVAERAIKTFSQFLIALTGYNGATGDFSNLNWEKILIEASIGAILSIFMSIASSFKGDKSSASLVD